MPCLKRNHCWYISCFCFLFTVDLLLDPENRVHMSPENQLKNLLDKLDMVTSMRTSGGRTKRMRLLRREINSLRHKISHQGRNSRLLNGKMKADKREDKMDFITSNPGKVYK